jgi:formylglycine-generating enzyme required for sulfatase activity
VLAALCLIIGTGHAQAQPDTVTNLLGMQFVTIPAGSFRMGTPNRQAAIAEMDEPDRHAFRDEQPAHRVRLSQPFLLGRTEVTQAQWFRVMQNKPGPQAHWRRADWDTLPVVSVSWHMAQRFAEELGKLDADYRYRLPTEAEWEYAARAGSTGLRPVPSDRLPERAWYIANSGDEPHPVATRRANAFGIHDMLGNAWEWVADWYAPDSYGDGTVRLDPTGPTDGRSRVRRGGSYHCPLHQTRPGYRSANTPETRYSVIGFRLVAVPTPPAVAADQPVNASAESPAANRRNGRNSPAGML